MKNLKKLILVRHADYAGDVADPGLSTKGKAQSLHLAESIKKSIGDNDLIIWTSSANRAKETAEIIQQHIPSATLVAEEKLWCDRWHEEDFQWLLQKVTEFEGEYLVIVSHLEYVQQFPQYLGYSGNRSEYACGVLIADKTCTHFS